MTLSGRFVGALWACCFVLAVGGGRLHAQGIRFSTVVIDAGHGGKDGGAVWNGLIEKKLCLDVAKRVESLLKARGIKTVMTRRSDVFVELEDRARRANRTSSSIFVSIHFNGSRRTAISGCEVYYRSSRGRILAAVISRRIKNNVTGGGRGTFYADYKVLRETRMPAVLVECGYLSNKREARRCADPSHRQEIADAIARGLLDAQRR